MRSSNTAATAAAIVVSAILCPFLARPQRAPPTNRRGPNNQPLKNTCSLQNYCNQCLWYTQKNTHTHTQPSVDERLGREFYNVFPSLLHPFAHVVLLDVSLKFRSGSKTQFLLPSTAGAWCPMCVCVLVYRIVFPPCWKAFWGWWLEVVAGLWVSFVCWCYVMMLQFCSLLHAPNRTEAGERRR